MGEGEEAVFSVVRAHATLTDTAEAHFTGGEMDDNVVDAAAAEADGVEKFFHVFAAAAEVICRK